MKVLLINPSTEHIVSGGVNTFIDSFVKENPMPPLGLMYLAAYTEKYGYEVKINDLNVESLDTRYTPDIVGITCTTLTLYDAIQAARNCKSIWNVPVVIGGSHCNIYPKETSQLEGIDYVIKGDGEVPFVWLLKNPRACPKIIEPMTIENLDSLPFPARHLVNLDKYHSALSKKLTTSMITSKGCPFSCNFCYQPHFGNKWRARSAESVVSEMVEIQKLGIGELEIYDDTFTYDRQRVVDICLDLIRLKLKLDWNIRTRVDRVDRDLLKLMSKAGCKRINYGIESANQQVLRTLRKGFTIDQINNAVKWTHEAGIELQAYFMLGNPDETLCALRDTINFANSIEGYCYFSLTSPFPGTKLYEQGLQEQRYKDYWREFAVNPTPDMKVRLWGEDKRNELINEMESAYKSSYFKPLFILKQLLKVRSMNELNRKAKMAMGMLK